MGGMNLFHVVFCCEFQKSAHIIEISCFFFKCLSFLLSCKFLEMRKSNFILKPSYILPPQNQIQYLKLKWFAAFTDTQEQESFLPLCSLYILLIFNQGTKVGQELALESKCLCLNLDLSNFLSLSISISYSENRAIYSGCLL